MFIEDNVLYLDANNIIITEGMSDKYFVYQVLDKNGLKTTEENLNIVMEGLQSGSVVMYEDLDDAKKTTRKVLRHIGRGVRTLGLMTLGGVAGSLAGNALANKAVASKAVTTAAGEKAIRAAGTFGGTVIGQHVGRGMETAGRHLDDEDEDDR